VDYMVMGLFIATWGQILPIYFYLGRVIGELKRINGKYIKEEKL